MPFCRKCGAELREDTQFCPSCGASVSASVQSRYATEREACFGPKGSGRGLWGAISGGVFVIGLGVLWLLDLFWPGILLLIGLMIIIGAIAAIRR